VHTLYKIKIITKYKSLFREYEKEYIAPIVFRNKEDAETFLKYDVSYSLGTYEYYDLRWSKTRKIEVCDIIVNTPERIFNLVVAFDDFNSEYALGTYGSDKNVRVIDFITDREHIGRNKDGKLISEFPSDVSYWSGYFRTTNLTKFIEHYMEYEKEKAQYDKEQDIIKKTKEEELNNKINSVHKIYNYELHEINN